MFRNERKSRKRGREGGREREGREQTYSLGCNDNRSNCLSGNGDRVKVLAVGGGSVHRSSDIINDNKASSDTVALCHVVLGSKDVTLNSGGGTDESVRTNNIEDDSLCDCGEVASLQEHITSTNNVKNVVRLEVAVLQVPPCGRGEISSVDVDVVDVVSDRGTLNKDTTPLDARLYAWKEGDEYVCVVVVCERVKKREKRDGEHT